MACIKTGAHVFLEEYGEFAYGDMHQFNGTYILRKAGQGPKPINGLDLIHFQVFNVEVIWDGSPYGVIVCSGVMDHGYDGKKIKDVLPHVKVGSE